MSRFRFGICEWCFPAVGPYVCRMAADAGLEGVALDLGSMRGGLRLTEPAIRRWYMDEARHSGVSFCALALNVFGGHTTLLRPDDPAQSGDVAWIIEQSVLAAAEMGIPVIQFPSFYENAMADRASMEASAVWFRRACALAEPCGIVIGTENTLSCEANLELLSLVDRPNFRVYFDTENPVFFGSGNPAEMLRRLSGRICQIHVKDGVDGRMSHTPLGEGHGCFKESARAILDTGYEGWILLENEYTGFRQDNGKWLARDLGALRRALSDR